LKAYITLWLLFFTGSSFSQVLQKGLLIDSIICDQTPNQSYALYLPSYYDSLKKWPAIYVFEPGARGSLPVNKFSPGAEELGYIIIASNNSRNGSWEVAFEAGDALFLDTFSKFSIDPTRVYTSGFSGGSRVASAIAAITGKINGVIACGAGFAGSKEYHLPDSSSVFYAAIVGNQDMNYQEHRQLAGHLEQKKVVNTLIIFNEGHQWPQSSYLTEALYWMELQCFKRGIATSENYSLMKSYELTKNRGDSMLQAGDMMMAMEVYRKMIKDYNGLLELSDLSAKISSIEVNKEYSKQLKKSERINEQELDYQKELSEAFTELYFTKLNVDNDSTLKDMNWWKNKINFIKRLAKKNDFQTQNMALRVLNLIWARSAESSFNYIDLKEFKTALVLNKIWLYTEPNTWGKWNMAKILAYMNDQSFIGYLEEVINESPKISKQLIMKENAFKTYLDDPKMKAILSQLE
jgi:hypothetical protein